MKRSILFLFMVGFHLPLSAWWDPGHLVTAMIAYMNLNEPAKAKVDSLTKVLERDYPYVNHFIVTSAWPDDLKAEGVRAFDSWHYTNLPYNPDGVALPPQPEVNVVWAINEALDILGSSRPRDIDKARFLGFLTHFAGDIHQPLHSTSLFTNEQAGGNQGGNLFTLEGDWRNLHMLWDDGCGYLSSFNDIRPYGEPKEALTKEEVERIRMLAEELMSTYPKEQFNNVNNLDPDFWALESHKLAIAYGYRGVNDPNLRGQQKYLMPGQQPSEYYLEQGQEIVRKRLALGGYRLAAILNKVFGEEKSGLK